MMEKIKQMNGMYKLYKMTKGQKKYLEELRKRFKRKEISLEESHKLWKEHPDYIKQYGKEDGGF